MHNSAMTEVKNNKNKEIAILGTRGVPAAYGGFETFAEEIGVRLIERGYKVRVYCRYYGNQRPIETEYRGMSLSHVRAVRQKYLETPLHSLFCFIDLIKQPCDLALLCNAANSPFAWIVKLLGIPLVINVDGIERKRAKWNWLGKLWYLLGEKTSVWFASKIVSDAQMIADYYQETYRLDTAVIAYGAEKKLEPAAKILDRFALKANNYILYVSRLEPENNALGVIEAYKLLVKEATQAGQSDLPTLVIVGDAPYAVNYKQELFQKAVGQNIVFTGFQFGQAYRELRSNCLLYIQATEVGGTHPALVEAMAYGNCIIANDVPEHREVLGAAGAYYSKNNWSELSQRIKELLDNPNHLQAFKKAAEERANQHYSWDSVTAAYCRLFETLGVSTANT